MAWTYNDIRIYPQNKEDKLKQIIARLNPLDSNTVLHRFGYDSRITSVEAFVVTDADVASLEGLITAGTSATLSGPDGVIGDFFLNTITSKLTDTVDSVWFDRPALDCDVPVYDVALELYIDE